MTANQTALLVRLYHEQPRTVDDLPYTKEMETIAHCLNKQSGTNYSRRLIWRTLVNLRKSKKMIRKTDRKVPT